MGRIDYEKREKELEERCESIPDLPDDFYDWSKTIFPENWCFYKRKKNKADMFCCQCGQQYTVRTRAKESYEGSLEKIHETPIHNTMGKCYACGATIIYKSGAARGKYYEDSETLLIGQKYKDRGYVLRNIVVYRRYGQNMANIYRYTELSRSFYLPGSRKVQEDWHKHDYWRGRDFWDCVGNGFGSRAIEHTGNIYPGTYPAMKGTVLEYSMITDFIKYSIPHPYRREGLYYYNLRNYLNTYFRYPVIEALVKMKAYGIVDRLEGTWRTNELHINNRAKNPYDMLRVKKKRLKDLVGDYRNYGKLEWAQWERKNIDMDDETFKWFSEKCNVRSAENMLKHMNPKQVMNYVIRQLTEEYKEKSVMTVMSQYNDYYEMCKKLHKDLSDEMVFRPRELKRRHAECVAAIERQRNQMKADEYSKKFSEAEKVLGEIKEKFEYTGEGFIIKVPDRIVDIVSEGSYLHHCAGATDRYFDRIKHNETYICFLRKIEEPEIPFYTIEVEPGGTIRQHRGMYDEEPELDKVKPFLQEWQQVIRQRMSKRDHELAAVSKEKREANIADLKLKNNTRVLQGLMEDFMEAI